MVQSKLAQVLNTILALSILALVVFAWIKHFTQNAMISIVLTAMIITITATEINHLRKKRTNRLNFKKADLNQKDNCMWHFLSSNTSSNLTYFKKLLNADYNLISKSNFLYSLETKTAIVPYFESENLTADSLIKIIKSTAKLDVGSIIIFCVNIDRSSQRVIANMPNLNITILNDYETYALIKHKQIFPILFSEIKSNKRSHNTLSPRNLLKYVNAKPFAICGLMLYATSFIVPFRSYYILWASVCLLFAFICLIFAQKPQNSPQFSTILKADALKK